MTPPADRVLAVAAVRGLGEVGDAQLGVTTFDVLAQLGIGQHGEFDLAPAVEDLEQG